MSRQVKSITHIVFDFDGTIADTIDFALTIYNRIAPEYGCKPIPAEDRSELIAQHWNEAFEKYGITQVKLLLLMHRVQKEMGKQLADLSPVEGMNASLQAVKDCGLKLGILTSNSVSNVRGFLENKGLSHLFDFVYSGKNLFGKDKVMNRLFKQEGLSKEAVIYVGDEKRDIEACKKVGIPIIAVTWGISDSKTLENLQPDKIAHTPADLLSCVHQLTV
jgi:phosphoglycolate phosphatase